MNIAYKGKFLREGLLAAGHRVYDLDLNAKNSVVDALARAPFGIDFIFWEFFGAFSHVEAIAQVDCPLAVWCIDSPINEFWFKHIAKYADYVFVDQPQSVTSLAQAGIQVHWLPLPASPSYFQPVRAKEIDLTFIGTIDAHRTKRSNLINLIKSKFDIQVISGVSIPKAQEIFSRSKIIINENFFPGLTLRILQGLSAGTVVFTEEINGQPDYVLKDGQDLIRFTSDNLLALLGETLANYHDYAEIAVNGQTTCRAMYSGTKIVERLTSILTTNRHHQGNPDQVDFAWNQLLGEIFHIQRFGGNLARAASRLREFGMRGSGRECEALIVQGDLLAKSARMSEARSRYSRALQIAPESTASLKLALLDIHQNDLRMAAKAIAAHRFLATGSRWDRIVKNGNLNQTELLVLLAEIYFRLGFKWEMGFSKSFPDPVPDTAFELARMAWSRSPDASSLEIMLECLSPWRMQGELLPYLFAGIERGLLSDAQILETARLAHEYYDHATAATILHAMKKAH